MPVWANAPQVSFVARLRVAVAQRVSLAALPLDALLRPRRGAAAPVVYRGSIAAGSTSLSPAPIIRRFADGGKTVSATRRTYFLLTNLRHRTYDKRMVTLNAAA